MTKGIIEARIVSNKEITAGVYRIILQSDVAVKDLEPGQFINVYLRNKSMLLPRPISICQTEGDQITLVYKVVGKGTKELSEYKAGELMKISSPLGQGYYLDAVFEELNVNLIDYESKNDDDRSHCVEKVIALVAGGLGVPPMVELAKTIRGSLEERNRSHKLIAVIGFQEKVFLDDELKCYCDEVYIATENGAAGYRGNVLEMMKVQDIKADYYLACGPKPMLKALADFCGKIEKPLQVSLEERMGCGYGACVGCTCKIRQRDSEIVKQNKICKDGPVFFGNEVVWDE